MPDRLRPDTLRFLLWFQLRHHMNQRDDANAMESRMPVKRKNSIIVLMLLCLAARMSDTHKKEARW